jgi:hypothetical protein
MMAFTAEGFDTIILTLKNIGYYCLVFSETIDTVWIGNRIYWALTNPWLK